MLALTIPAPSSCNQEVSSFPLNTVLISQWPGPWSVISPVPESTIPLVFAEMSPAHWGPKSHCCHPGQNLEGGSGRKEVRCLSLLQLLSGCAVCPSWEHSLLSMGPVTVAPSLADGCQASPLLWPFRPRKKCGQLPLKLDSVPWPSLSPMKALSFSPQISRVY